MTNAVLDVALAGLRLGLSIVPPRMDGSKQPLGTWATYQAHRPDERTVRSWYTAGNTGVGCVCGQVSGNLELFEFDDLTAFSAYLRRAQACGLGPLVSRVRGGYEETTPGKGVHWLYRCKQISGNTKLARRDPKLGGQTLIETKGEGGYVIVAPSNGKVHPTGDAYRLRSGSLATIPTITPDERAQLWELARTFDEAPRGQMAPHTNQQAADVSGGRPGDDYNLRADWADVLTPCGWRHLFEHNGADYWCRPGKDGGTSATTNYHGSNLLYVFSTSTAFESERGYSKFAAHALLNHAGDYRAAAAAIRQAGYGSAPEAPREDAPVRTAKSSDMETPYQLRPGLTPIGAKTLWAKQFPELRWAVDGLLPEGVTLCAGRPKQGKSWLALNLAIAVAAGGKALGSLAAHRGSVLYLALEDNERSLQKRLQTVLSGEAPPEGLDLATECPRLGDGGLDAIDGWLQLHPDARLIIIDTLQKLRPPTNGKQGIYEQDYEALQPLLSLAKRSQCPMLMIHHTRKMQADDPFDAVSGTLGLTGAVDTLWVLERVRGQDNATLRVTGRQLPDQELGLEWDSLICTWRHVGEGKEVRRSRERQAIVTALRNSSEPLKPQEVAMLVELEYNFVRKLLWLMSQTGEINGSARSGYSCSQTEQTEQPRQVEQVELTDAHTDSSIEGLSTNASGVVGLSARARDTPAGLHARLYKGTEVPCYWCKQPAPVGAQYGPRWTCPECIPREESP